MDNIAKGTLDILNESIMHMNEKKDITPTDLEILCKAYKLKQDLEYYYGESEEDTRSSHMGRMYGDMWDDKHGMMRSPVTGRYVARDAHHDDHMEGRMSGHSIQDRMIAQLEQMYDEANGDYEREEIRKEIRQIQMEK